jgi:hypothetical protein
MRSPHEHAFANLVTAGTWTAKSAWLGSYNTEFIITGAFAPEQETEFTVSASFSLPGHVRVEMTAAFVAGGRRTRRYGLSASFAPAMDIGFTASASFVMQDIETSVQRQRVVR